MTAIAGPGEPSPGQLVRCAVLEDAEQAELLPARALRSDLVVAAHGAVHRLPPSTARVAGRRSLGDIVEHCHELGADPNGAPV